MSQVTFQGEPVAISGSFVQAGSQLPSFTLTSSTLEEIKWSDLCGTKLVINVFPSIDTPVCAASVRRFNKEASHLENVVVLCISADLPFAANRFCAIEGLKNVRTASFFRSPLFTEHFGVKISEGPLEGLSARAILIVDEEGLVTYSELVSEITNEPNYTAALDALNALS
ncbi:thiol peroxidase [Vibrio sp. S4M6]|uniref:thiol peroxidase n=1 Tax=Vibrio sinus TaxID=2946865 RepID=UPI00202A5C96|nr:thiol peroxidase [Vibrio sinus]MCL9781623.1 thiol peroxidase [Vibrio sinus]